MRFSIVMPVMNQVETTAATLDILLKNTTGDYELVVVDNASTDGTVEYLERDLSPRLADLQIIRNPANLGVVASLRQGWGAARGDIIAFLHNDVHVLEAGWNLRVLALFDRFPFLGLAGFHGSRGTPDGWNRIEPWSNMVQAEAVGRRLDREYLPVALLDGLCLIARRGMLDKTGGFDPNYRYYAYDCDLALASLAAGYRNIVVNVPCHHVGSMTSRHTGDWNQAELHRSLNHLAQKWRPFLPVYVGEDFSLNHATPAASQGPTASSQQKVQSWVRKSKSFWGRVPQRR